MHTDSKPHAYEVAKNVIKDHMNRCNIYAEVTDGFSLGNYELKCKVKVTLKVDIITLSGKNNNDV